jgi:hypothetical protein
MNAAPFSLTCYKEVVAHSDSTPKLPWLLEVACAILVDPLQQCSPSSPRRPRKEPPKPQQPNKLLGKRTGAKDITEAEEESVENAG